MTMASTQPTQVTTGAERGVLKGEFRFLRDLAAFSEDVENTLNLIFAEARENALTEIRTAAESHQDWKRYADLIDVRLSEAGDLEYVLVGDEQRVKEAFDLEYGTPGNTPKSLLRKFAVSQMHTLPESMTMEVPLAQPWIHSG
jgi:hypothetical protein